MVGIYKITSPSGRVYIGQSINIRRRKNYYAAVGARGQSFLCNSFKKYGFNNHKLEVVHELPKDVSQYVLNNYEQLYIDAYRDSGFDLMNLREGGSNGKLHPSVVEKIRLKNIGKKRTKEFKALQADRTRNMIRTEEWNKNISKGKIGKPNANKGRKMSEYIKDKNRDAQIKYHKENPGIRNWWVAAMAEKLSRPVIQLNKDGGFIKKWRSMREAERHIGIFATSIRASIRGVRCKYAGGFKWQYKNAI